MPLRSQSEKEFLSDFNPIGWTRAARFSVANSQILILNILDWAFFHPNGYSLCIVRCVCVCVFYKKKLYNPFLSICLFLQYNVSLTLKVINGHCICSQNKAQGEEDLAKQGR